MVGRLNKMKNKTIEQRYELLKNWVEAELLRKKGTFTEEQNHHARLVDAYYDIIDGEMKQK